MKKSRASKVRDHVTKFRADYVMNTLWHRGSNVKVVDNLTTRPARELHRALTQRRNSRFSTSLSLVLGHCDNELSSPSTPPPIHSPTGPLNIHQPAQPLIKRSQQTSPPRGSPKACELGKESVTTTSPSECQGSASLTASSHSR